LRERLEKYLTELAELRAKYESLAKKTEEIEKNENSKMVTGS
jgi:hypothetical protein